MKKKSRGSEGKRFEDNWKSSYEGLPLFYLRLNDTAKWQRGSDSSFTPENPYDCLQFKPPFLWLLELKSTCGSSINFNKDKPDEPPKNTNSKVMIKHNQVRELLKARNIEGVIPGFMLNYRERTLKTKTEPNEVYFLHINDFIKFAKKSNKTSINREDANKIAIKINGRKKKTNYSYYISEFIDNSIQYCLKENYISTHFITNLIILLEEYIKNNN